MYFSAIKDNVMILVGLSLAAENTWTEFVHAIPFRFSILAKSQLAAFSLQSSTDVRQIASITPRTVSVERENYENCLYYCAGNHRHSNATVHPKTYAIQPNVNNN